MEWLISLAITALSVLSPSSEDVYHSEFFTIASIVSAAIAAAVAGGVAISNSVSAKRAKKAADRTIGGLKADNATAYYQDYYRSALDNDSTRAYLKRLDKQMAKQNQTLDNKLVSTGATTENKLAAKESRNAVMSDAMSKAVQAEDARRQNIRNNYFNRNQNLSLQQLQVDQNYAAQKQQNLAQLGGAVSQAASAATMAFAPQGGGGGSSAPLSRQSIDTNPTWLNRAAYAPTMQEGWRSYYNSKHPQGALFSNKK